MAERYGVVEKVVAWEHAALADLQARVEVLEACYDAFNRRDLDAVLARFHPDVEWPNLLKLTTMRGHRAVRAYWEEQFARFDPTVEPTGFTDIRGRVVANVNQIVRDLNGTLLSETMTGHSFTFRGDLVAAMRIHAPIPEPAIRVGDERAGLQ